MVPDVIVTHFDLKEIIEKPTSITLKFEEKSGSLIANKRQRGAFAQWRPKSEQSSFNLVRIKVNLCIKECCTQLF